MKVMSKFILRFTDQCLSLVYLGMVLRVTDNTFLSFLIDVYGSHMTPSNAKKKFLWKKCLTNVNQFLYTEIVDSNVEKFGYKFT